MEIFAQIARLGYMLRVGRLICGGVGLLGHQALQRLDSADSVATAGLQAAVVKIFTNSSFLISDIQQMRAVCLMY